MEALAAILMQLRLQERWHLHEMKNVKVRSMRISIEMKNAEVRSKVDVPISVTDGVTDSIGVHVCPCMPVEA